MTTMPIEDHPLTQRRLQFIGIGVNKLTLKSINIISSVISISTCQISFYQSNGILWEPQKHLNETVPLSIKIYI